MSNQNGDVSLEIRIDAPPETVFPYLVEPAKVVRWIGYSMTSAGKVGNPYRLDMWGDGSTVAAGDLLVVDPPNQVVFSWGWEGSSDLAPGASTVTIDLASVEGGTMVKLTHSGLDAVQAESHTGGWTNFLDRLEQRASGGSPGPNYSMDYSVARAKLLDAEVELMSARESVAELRRKLPSGPLVDDYVFAAADGEERLSELFSGPDRTLVLYHFMFGNRFESPCPMCSMWTDGWDAVAHHIHERFDFAVVSSAPISDTSALAQQRGWTDLKWLSAADSDFKLDIGGEDADGNLMPFLSVYRLEEGRPRLTWSGGAHLAGDHWRGVDLLSPIWHFLDLTPEGRGDWMPSLDY